MHKEADGTWHADLDPAADLPLTPEPQAAMPAPAPPAADPSLAGVAMPSGMQPPPTPPFNVCSWYNADAAGVFVDDRSATLTATVQLATSLLTVMTS
jgi:hypothetical protein